MIEFTVLGIAQPKGSTRAFMRPGMKFPVVTSANKSVKGWEDSVRHALQQHASGVFFDGPVAVSLSFYLPRPQSLPRKIKHHTKRPDADKLARSTIDAMTGVLWKDDAQVVNLFVRKSYAEDQPSAVIRVEEVH